MWVRSFPNVTSLTDCLILFIQAENAYAGRHMAIVVSPWCIPLSLSLSLALWPSGRLAWRRLAFLELGSIFNRVAPLPDGPAIYGPERGARLELTECTGRRG